MTVMTSVLAMLLTAIASPGSAQEDAGLGGNRLQQVALTTGDLPRAIAFYRGTLGLTLMFETNGMAFFDMAGTRLMIAVDPQRASAGPAAIVYIDTPTFVATVARLKMLRVPLEGGVETVQRSAGGELKLQQFRDPDGNALAVMGLVPAR